MSECPYCTNSFEMNETCHDEFRMWQGLVGPYYTPSVDNQGNLSWTNTGGLPNPNTVNIKGADGASFEIAGIVETVGDLPESASGVWLVGTEAPYEGYSYIDGAWASLGQFAIGPRGEQGEPGPAGATGAAAGFGTPTATVDSSTGTPSVTVTTSGPDTAKVFAFAFHNLKGEKGDSGGGAVETVNNVTPDQYGNITLTADDIGTDATNISIQDALDDYVYVGTSAPTDPTTKIWLDTDEPGMSGVSSVNGKTGTVVLDAADVGAMAEWDLLWENASPTSDFAAQTLTLNTDEYDFIAVDTNTNKAGSLDTDPSHIVFAPIITGRYFNIGGINPNNTYYHIDIQRTCIFTSATVLSIGSSKYSWNNGYASNRNDLCIPIRIWGIKGVQLS